MSTRFRKVLRYGLLAMLILLVVLYFVGNVLLDRMSRDAMVVLAQKGPAHGMDISEPGFRTVRLSGVRSAHWNNLHATLRFTKSKTFNPERLFEVRVESLDGWLTGQGNLALTARGITIESDEVSQGDAESDDSKENDMRETISVGFVDLEIEIDLSNPLQGLEGALPELVSLAIEGTTPLSINTEGELEFTLKREPAKVRFRVEDDANENRLMLFTEDLRPISRKFDEELTEAEMELISRHPLRTPNLLRIKDDAESTAKKAFNQDNQVPQDAYRHVLWSFLLTRKYDSDFAQEVTDSHEQGDTGNTPAERDMDYRNNAVGRRYAREKIGRSQILTRLLSDPEVVLSAQ